MKKPIFTGSGVAIITPFAKDGSIDFEELGKILEFQIENETDAIIICGTTGESAAMPDSEHLSVIDYTVKKVNGRIPVIAGTGSNDTAHGINLCKAAEKLGVDGLLTVTPYYNKTTQRGLVKHFTALANSVKIPLILYNVPSRTGLNIKPDTLLELSKVENIIGIKEASGNITQVAHMAAKCPDMVIYSGNDDQIIPIMSVGGLGVISVLANIEPKKTHDMCQKFLDKDTEGAMKLQLEAMEVIDALFCEVNPIPVKKAMSLMGYNTDTLRLPLCEISPENEKYLRRALVNYGIKLVK
ncbi:4-hydroxy-tetrahydrodipicolinate synthase [Qingrenia yutianensis]|uniref:4-hydroxy-tetrahydrodipicolinate synthase n=1 Tax=Qingrenia yutianensis TaxID=2763676 RepID=A0A926IUC9_9FIRM|nr:4-hydroxy-tetrahydrodipicolinate synthase [Qingrenia yutianensis]MBC8596683.1 4-hydroxy-tetrahydrodipicolinate synthase [Qingrenia yutianensis]